MFFCLVFLFDKNVLCAEISTFIDNVVNFGIFLVLFMLLLKCYLCYLYALTVSDSKFLMRLVGLQLHVSPVLRVSVSAA